MLKLKEKTLCLMDVSINYENVNEKTESEVFEMINRIKKYNGEFVILWHNSNFLLEEWYKRKFFYEKILLYANGDIK